MAERSDPLRVEYVADLAGLTVVRQAPPAGSASFSATYVGPAGWAFDPRGRAGTARLVSRLVTSGAGPYDRVALARRLDRAGATLSSQSAPESGEVTIWGPADQWRPLLGLLAEVVLRPRFEPADVERVRRQALERSQREMAQPASRADFEFLRAVFPEGHPYRSTGFGEPSSLRRISRANLIRFHRTHYVSEGAKLVITAPARAGAVRSLARAAFGSFAELRGPTVPVASTPPRRATERKIDLVGRSQVEIRVGGMSIPRSAAAYPAAFLANEILGGRPLLSRLFQRVREQGGLAYHASSSLEAMQWGGYWTAQAGTGAERWRRVVPMLHDEVRRLDTSSVRTADLDRIRESAIGEIPLSLESTSEAHELAVDVAYHGLPSDYWIRWSGLLRAVSASQVRDAADLALDLQAAATVIAGPLDRTR